MILLFMGMVSAAQLSAREHAEVLPRGSSQLGVFGPLRLGLGEDMELSTQPLANLLAPNVSLKKELSSADSWTLSAQGDLAYTSFLIDTLARDGIGGVLPPDIEIPQRVDLNVRMLWTKSLVARTSTHYLTTRLRTDFALPPYIPDSSKGMSYSSIDVPLVYVRTHEAAFSINAGTQIDGPIGERFGYELGAWYWFVPSAAEGNWSVEQRSVLSAQLSSLCWMQAGAVTVIGDYPYGRNWNVLPVVDFKWQWSSKGKKPKSKPNEAQPSKKD